MYAAPMASLPCGRVCTDWRFIDNMAINGKPRCVGADRWSLRTGSKMGGKKWAEKILQVCDPRYPRSPHEAIRMNAARTGVRSTTPAARIN
ncbi:hypothetical protein PUNSTDRAFT_123099 [Punctularia strigosozonata HHB-11173 SS5]|uniref:Uncharacterized protein n=1 Tax=Punctularia strigosozonata (strain HHB-11173) TaxID=741275 RepID=R7S203_PUNST|nr:uncharacterized protein PUNSTDRAFT_123099 [Punctularia strigosozonata HHB-11173 SS5]EIN03807.1 hypothetical protein PUNSTDRAFT_123099 [Punctularia strigosozonata HHB-11173 SS5]